MINNQKTTNTKSFYDNLINGKIKRGLWGKEKRFDSISISQKESTKKFFTPLIEKYLNKNDNILELGCGPGGFLAVSAGYCKKIVGVDISSEFIKQCNNTIETLQLSNAQAIEVTGDVLPFDENSFDAIIMVDVVHHLENVSFTLNEVKKVLKKNGKLIIFEPNKLNPALFLMCVLDRNEWGLLSLGTKKIYKSVLEKDYNIIDIDYNGLLVGPDSNFSLSVADFLSSDFADPWLRWLSPKIFIAAELNK